MIAAMAIAAAVYASPGMTYSQASVQTGVSVAAIESANPWPATDIPVGAEIQVPGGVSGTSSPGSGLSSYPSSSPSGSGGGGGSCGSRIRFAENSGSYAWGTGNGGGAYQFTPSTWAAYAPAGAVWGSASPAQQDQAFQNAVSAVGTSPWTPFDGVSC
jgi:hypothetical protein